MRDLETQKISALTLISSLFMIFFCLTPVVFMMFTSFSQCPDFLSPKIPFLFTWENYRSILSRQSLHFPDYLKNSFLISSASALLAVAIASPAAFALTRLSLRGKIPLLLFILSVSMFPQISLTGFLFKMMTRLGLINTYPALIAPYIAWILPLTLWILTSYFAKIPKELDEAASIDGCSPLKTLVHIILPTAAPGILSSFLLAFIFSFNEFMFALMLTTDHSARTLPVGISFFQGLHGEIPWGTVMAASTLTILPIVLLTLFFQKHIVRGLTRGAVKG